MATKPLATTLKIFTGKNDFRKLFITKVMTI